MKNPALLPLAAHGALAALLLLGSFAGCGGEGGEPPTPAPPAPATWDFGLPAGYPKPKISADNPMTVDKVELGRRLFYDKRLSGNETQSCASCHDQKLAFTDGRAGGLGSTGEVHPRSSMSIVNVAYLSTLTWANPLITELEEQALLPLFGETPVELGLAGKEDVLLERLRKEPVYEALFPKAFPDEADPVRLENVVRAIGAFERSVISYRSAYDRYNYGGDSKALSEAQKRGKDLFFSEKLECFHCHGGFNFSDSVVHDGSTFTETMFHNTGLYNLGGTGAYPDGNRGVYEVTGVSTDMGRFRAPTLRNITITAPYMHDGSIATLGEVLDHYAAGGRTIVDGPYAGVGSKNPYKSELINGFSLTEDEKADVLAFLASLTDEALLVDPRFADPWKQDSAGGMP
ncbi:methanobactin export MATE transporter MbnM [Polyangium sp. 6x1]|uniref:methanobactin export MATE transporter MbnM n=1 Tax=Polyangium sp. 6x1 TaxID=3042689 RepID=UPI0024827BC9|nr:methanobactin export MATE transporter MbnM [Polyangium sp. 6x1]MDI1447355.1 di-heme enzyme [Polyangium sp. 6x1]